MKHVKKIAIALAGLIMVLAMTFLVGLTTTRADDDYEETYAEAYADGMITGETAIEVAKQTANGQKAIGAALVVGIAACGGAIGMGMAIAKANEGTARQPEAASRIQTMLMLGLVFIETVVIYALIVAILIIFVM
jgi:F-type H+-transporting ATPase subunit c